jgi:transcriptional regulator GlxA family with amidase domain
MASIISEAKDSFSTPLGDPYTAELLRSEKPRFAGEQLISNYLQILLIRLVRLYIGNDTQARSPQMISETQNSQLAKIISFLEEHVESRITFPDVCEHFGISGSHLKKIFKNEIGSGVMEYYNKCKIDRAKKLIRERELNFSQISEKLEFNSVQYFSRAFRAHTGMTPSEYEESVISMVDKK